MRTLIIGWHRGRLELKQFFRQKESVVFTIAFPIVFMAIFGAIFHSNIVPGVTFSQYFVAGMIATGVVNSGFQQLAIMIPMERDNGTLKRLRGTPMPALSYFIGKLIVVFVAVFVQVGLLMGLGTILFHLHMPASSEKWLRFIWLLVLGSICTTVLGIAFAAVPKSGRGASAVVSPIVIILQFFSGVFVVFTQLPKWMQTFAALFPLKWLTQGMRSVFLPDSFVVKEASHSWEIGRTLLVLTVWAIAGTVLAIKTFRWSNK